MMFFINKLYWQKLFSIICDNYPWINIGVVIIKGNSVVIVEALEQSEQDDLISVSR